MILDFSFKQVMKLSSIKRWQIIEMSKEQSVAEHSYNVTMISIALINGMDLRNPSYIEKTSIRQEVIGWGLCHDLTELFTGDIPSPIKSRLKCPIDNLEANLFPMWSRENGNLTHLARGIIKIADYMDAIQFAEKFCIDDDREAIIDEMRAKMIVTIKATDPKHEFGLMQVADTVMGS